MCVCVDARLILVLVLGRQIVYGQKTVYLCLTRYIVFEMFVCLRDMEEATSIYFVYYYIIVLAIRQCPA